jgi:hypothetical protein
VPVPTALLDVFTLRGVTGASAVVSANTAVNVIAIGLIVLGVVLFVVTISFWRSSLEDPAVLAPLEIMQDRKFARADADRRTQLLNTVRTPDAPVPVSNDASSPLLREPVSEPERPFRDPFPHDDDAVDVVPRVIDPLLSQQQLPRDDQQQRSREDQPRINPRRGRPQR